MWSQHTNCSGTEKVSEVSQRPGGNQHLPQLHPKEVQRRVEVSGIPEAGEEREVALRERKTVVIPLEVFDDPRLSLSDIGLLGKILRSQNRIDKITVANLKSILNESEKTIRKGLDKLAENGYLTRASRYGGWKVTNGKISRSERENLPFRTVKFPFRAVKFTGRTVKSPERAVKFTVRAPEEERTKEEDNNKLYWCNNNNNLIRDTGLKDIESCSILTDSKDTVSVNIESETILTTPENNDKDIAKQGACASAGARVREGEKDEPEAEDKPKPKRAVFVKPTREEVLAYCRERQSTVSSSVFYDFYESKGWMVGKNHMKDWKAAVRTWEQKDKQSGRYYVPAENRTDGSDDLPY